MRLQMQTRILRVGGRDILESRRPHHLVILLCHWLRQTATVILMGDAHQTTQPLCRGLDSLKGHVILLQCTHRVDYQHTASHHDDHNRMVSI